ncbi:MAG: tetratricopeptide repeat protein [Oscillospiraceae bacterium]|nr:tetratricopeptide repeat protein [Oscillospiraceae bacterium]
MSLFDILVVSINWCGFEKNDETEDASLSISISIVTTALKIACALYVPNIFLQESFDTFVNEAAAFYSSSQNTLTKNIENLIKQETSGSRLEQHQIPRDARENVVAETKRILEEVPITIDTISRKRFDNTSLENALMEQYEKACNSSHLENRKYILSLLKSILPKLIQCLSKDSSFLFNGLLLIRASFDELSRELDELKYQSATDYQNNYPIFLSDRPYDLTESFFGREHFVQKVREQLDIQSSLTLWGIGGIGKTEIAKAVINGIENTSCDVHKITHIAWVNYDNHNVYHSITQSFRETRDIEDYEKAWDKAYSIIQKYRHNLLLVIDNVETIEDKNLSRMADLPCRLLFTSRVGKISSIQTLKVNSLTINECIELFMFHYRLRPAPKYIIQDIIKLADKHTVTIELLAKIAQVEEMKLPDFHQRLIELGFNLSEEKAAVPHERLQKEEKIIQQLSVLFSVQRLTKKETDVVIPISVIPSLPFSFLQARDWFQQKDRSILKKLSESGWLQSMQKGDCIYYVMHSVIASAVRHQYQSVLYDRCKGFVHSLIGLLQYGEDEHGSSKADLVQFSWSVNDLLETNLRDETDADFLYFLSRVYMDIGNYSQAEKLLRHTVRIYRKQSETNIQKLAHAYNSIGLVFNDTYAFVPALTQYKKAIKLMKEVASSPNDWIPLYTNIGTTYMAIEGTRIDGTAYAFLTTALGLAEKEYGEDDPRTLNIKFKLANCISTSNPDAAKRIFYEVIDAEEKKYSSNHWVLADKYQGFGNFLFESGNYREAEEMLKKSLNIFSEQIGENNPTTADVKNTLGLINQFTDPTKAKRYFLDYLKNAQDTYGERSPATAAAWNNLGLCLFNEGNIDTALTYFRKASDILGKLKGAHHDDLGSFYSNQGQCYDELKEFKNAIYYYKLALDEYKKDEEVCAANIATLYGQMAVTYGHLKDKDREYEYFIKAEKEVKILWGEHHIRLASILNNYAMRLEQDNRYQEALDKLNQAKQIMEDTYQKKTVQISDVEKCIVRIKNKMKEADKNEHRV